MPTSTRTRAADTPHTHPSHTCSRSPMLSHMAAAAANCASLAPSCACSACHTPRAQRSAPESSSKAPESSGTGPDAAAGRSFRSAAAHLLLGDEAHDLLRLRTEHLADARHLLRLIRLPRHQLDL
jgi:hypothetical protein